MMFLLVIISTKIDVVIGDNIDMRMMLLLMIMLHEVMPLLMIMLIWDDVIVDNAIEMKWCWCWEWHWDEMMLRMTLRWDNVDVDNALRWDVDVENVIMMMYVVYVHGGCNDHDGYPWWGK